jgi:hypothetical protein
MSEIWVERQTYFLCYPFCLFFAKGGCLGLNVSSAEEAL